MIKSLSPSNFLASQLGENKKKIGGRRREFNPFFII